MTAQTADCHGHRSPRVAGSRDGFALPAAIMALVLLSALVAGALYVSTEELRAGRSDLADQRALAAAEAALERAIVEWDARRNTQLAVGGDVVVSRTASASRDMVEVSATRVQRGAFWMTARATSGADGRPIPARHTIAATLRLVGPRFPLAAALTAGGVVSVIGGTIDGRDGSAGGAGGLACADDAPADVAGLIVPDSSLACGVGCSGAPPPGVTGNPPVAVGPGLTSDSAAASFGDDTRASLERRASAVVAAGTLVPRPTVTAGVCDRSDPLNWGDPAAITPCADHYPIVRIRGDAILAAGSVGQGVLLVDGTLRVDSGARFAGVVIATNDIEVVGAGAEITGVAFAIDADRGGASRVSDGGVIRFASCAVQRASMGVARLTRTPVRWWAELR